MADEKGGDVAEMTDRKAPMPTDDARDYEEQAQDIIDIVISHENDVGVERVADALCDLYCRGREAGMRAAWEAAWEEYHNCCDDPDSYDGEGASGSAAYGIEAVARKIDRLIEQEQGK